MGTPRFTPEFKEEAVRQVTEQGYSVADVSERLGVSAHSLYKWVGQSDRITAGIRRRIYWMRGRRFSGLKRSLNVLRKNGIF